MSEEKSSVQILKTLELTDGEDKDKDKINSNEIKILFNISSYLKESVSPKLPDSPKKIKRKTLLRNHSLPYKTHINNRYNENNSIKDIYNKENSYDDILTIINSSKKNKINSSTQKGKKPLSKNIKKKLKKADLFNSLKYKNIKPQKDFSFKNSTFTVFQKDNDKNKFKNDSTTKFLEPKNKNKESKTTKNTQREKRQILDPKLQKILSKSTSIITTYLNRKKIDNLPVIYPLFLSYNNSYDTQSEKFRVNKILEKFVQLKTQIIKDYKNKEKIMKEFILRNGINDKKYFTIEKYNNLNEYLKKPFKFDSKKTISEIIKEALNYKTEEILVDRNKLFPVNLFNNFNMTNNQSKFIKTSKNNSLNNINKKPNEKRQTFQNPISLKFEELKYDNEHLPKLIMELEENLEKIQNEGDEKINKLRGGVKKLKQFKIKDKNKLLPNLCLVNEDFKGQYEYLMNKANVKLQNNYNRQKHIKEINDRMYYNNMKKKYLDQGFSDEIKRKLKLTEYIIVQRAKKKMFLEQFNKIGNKPAKI